MGGHTFFNTKTCRRNGLRIHAGNATRQNIFGRPRENTGCVFGGVQGSGCRLEDSEGNGRSEAAEGAFLDAPEGGVIP